MSSLYLTNQALVDIEDVVYDEKLANQIANFLEEYEHIEILQKYGLPVANKLFMYGKSGCGKTMTAKAIANKLGKKLYTIDLSSIVSSRLGETAKNLSSLFKNVEHKQAVLFFDEFDSLGSIRDYDNNDSSEMKRVVNSIIQLIDSFPSHAILIAATNQIQLIDEALLRRFDLQLEFKTPPKAVLDTFYDRLLLKFPAEYRVIERIYDLSYAEAQNHVFDAVKKNIIKAQKK
jgi:SpoVK/Ycf46/Vps4 family AAA+-type ATPase